MKRTRASFLLLTLGLVGCGGGNSTAFIRSYCDYLQTCCAGAGLKMDAQSCRNLYGSLVAFGGSYVADKGTACLTELEAASQTSAGFCDDLGKAAAPSCEGAFTTQNQSGNKKPGETCSFDDECKKPAAGQAEC